VRLGASADDRARDAYVFAHPRATFFHQSAWRRFVEEVWGHTPHELCAFRGSRLVGVLPLMEVPALFGGRNLLSMPYAVYGGPVGDDRTVELALLEAARREAEQLSVGHLELRYSQDPEVELPGTSLYWTFVRALPEAPADVLALMPKKARAEARRARRDHGRILSEGAGYVGDLARLFLKNTHQLGSPALPARHFRALLESFPGRAWVHLVRRTATPLAAVMSFEWRDTLIAYYAGTETGADRAYSASNFMYLALQEWAVERGFRVFDFCRSRQGSGAFEFKRHQGFEPTQLHYRFHLVRRRRLPTFNPSNPRTSILRNAWARLPLGLAARASARIARYLP
jgi:FemAB-related protein (PEP-CTERM system-associated)